MAEEPKSTPKKRRKKSGQISHADIARAAKVSPGLVSAFFSGNHYGNERKSGIGISEATRQRIKETCLKLNYVPDNPLGFFRLYPERADVAYLLNQYVTDGFTNPYHSLLFEGFAKSAFELQVDLSNLFFRTDRDYLVTPEGLPNAILRGAIKKVAVTGQPANYSLIYQLLRMEVAVVLVGYSTPIDGVVSVVPDFKEGARLAVHTLYEYGHRRIAVAGYPRNLGRGSYSSRHLIDGLVQGFQEVGLPFDENAILEAETGCHDVAAQIAKQRERPTALFCLEDQMAREVSLALGALGIRVPDDISILGCNDDRINQENQPGFSSIHLPCRQVGARAFVELNRIASEGRPEKHETIMLPVRYVDNGTVRKLSPS